jgi:hypothetical protein
VHKSLLRFWSFPVAVGKKNTLVAAQIVLSLLYSTKIRATSAGGGPEKFVAAAAYSCRGRL